MKFAVIYILFCFLLFTSCPVDTAGREIPIYIEDYHTGSFYWLAENLDWGKEYELILFDAHSDARCVFKSRLLRQDLIKALKQGKIKEFLAALRDHNIIQGYNWLEPLMPVPVSRVTWIFPWPVNQGKKAALLEKVKKVLCPPQEQADQEPCPLADSYTVTDFESLSSSYNPGKPCVVSIDLDYFANLNEDAAEKRLKAVLDFSLKIAGLKAVTVAVSNIYLKNEAQGHRLLFFLLQYLLADNERRVFFEPFAKYGRDLSLEAQEFTRQGRELPVYDIEQAPDYLRKLVCAHRERIVVRQDCERWQALLSRWQNND
jgi:hypothetical protein